MHLDKNFRSKDPSPPLAWWDKLRFLTHGRLLVCVKTLKLQMHTTLDPYNTTEEVELTFADANFDWTNGQFKVLADEMNLFVRTASKYDDCQLMHVPNVVRFLELFTILLVERLSTLIAIKITVFSTFSLFFSPAILLFVSFFVDLLSSISVYCELTVVCN